MAVEVRPGSPGTLQAAHARSAVSRARAGRVGMPILLGAGVLLALVGAPGSAGCRTPSPAPPAATRDGRWRQDIQYFAGNLKRLHKDPFRFASRARFDAGVAELNARVPERADHELAIGLAQLAAQLGDLHTKVVFDSRPDVHWFPVAFSQFSDGVYVVAVTQGLEELLGTRLVGVEHTPLAEARVRIATVVSHENEATLNVYVPRYLRCAEVLHTLRLSRERGQATFVLAWPDGREEPRTLTAAPADPPPLWITYHAHHACPLPLYLQNREQNYWYQYLEAERALYCAYNACAEMPGRPFGSFADEVLRFVDEHPVERFVLDLRNNGGGNSMIAWRLLIGLEWRSKINRPGRLFCLIGKRTMSSGALNALDLKRKTAVVWVGEPTGQKPNSFGELRTFTLPNSGLPVAYSTKYFHMYDDLDPPSYLPDVEVAPCFADYAAGRDPVLEAALGYAAPERGIPSSRSEPADAGPGIVRRRTVAGLPRQPCHLTPGWTRLSATESAHIVEDLSAGEVCRRLR